MSILDNLPHYEITAPHAEKAHLMLLKGRLDAYFREGHMGQVRLDNPPNTLIIKGVIQEDKINTTLVKWYAGIYVLRKMR